MKKHKCIKIYGEECPGCVEPQKRGLSVGLYVAILWVLVILMVAASVVFTREYGPLI